MSELHTSGSVGSAGGIAALLAAAEPSAPRPLADLVARLRLSGVSAVALDPAGGEGDPGAPGRAVLVSGLVADSREVRSGSVFVAIPGAHADGHDHLASALANGAAAALVERPIHDVAIPQLVVPSARRALAEAAAWWYGDPSHELGVIGITGTDGKTTTCLLAAEALQAAGIQVGLLGTVATQIGGIREPNAAHSTTPEAPALQRALRAMVAAGDRAVVLETTSHGLALDRVAAVSFDVAVFTNLTHEHLDLHGTFEAYRDAKRSLFDRLAETPSRRGASDLDWPRTGIVNADDPATAVFQRAALDAGARLLTYGRAAGADVRLIDAVDHGNGLRIAYQTVDGRADLRLQLAGHFNAHNALAVVALGRAIGLDPAAVQHGLERLGAVSGRMERVARGQPFDVVIDYAHSPASLATVLDELGARAAGRGGSLIVVIGSAGERDRDKRPMLGRVAAERCRVVVIADEDPRGEDPNVILAEIAAGARAVGRAELILEIADRRTAIREALRRANPADVVVLAGKGHETTILQATSAQPWNERTAAEAGLADLGWGV